MAQVCWQIGWFSAYCATSHRPRARRMTEMGNTGPRPSVLPGRGEPPEPPPAAVRQGSGPVPAAAPDACTGSVRRVRAVA